MPVPKTQRGAVIKADMAVFDLGPTGLTGPFQVLYRTNGMDAAATWMASHDMPSPARGVRNTGEQAMLVGPEQACGAYLGFAGPA
jgi:hypothetical protein